MACDFEITPFRTKVEDCPGCERCADFNDMVRKLVFNARAYREVKQETNDFLFVIKLTSHIQDIENERRTKGPVQ